MLAATSRARCPTLARSGPPVGRPAVVLVVQLDVRPAGQQFDGLGEGQVVDLLDEAR